MIVEIDGWDFHRERDAFERDRHKDVIALAAGIVTVRLTSRRMAHEPSEEAARLRAILAARRRRAA